MGLELTTFGGDEIAVVVVLLVIAFIVVRNRIIGRRNRVDESWSGIDVQLKRRHDVVPNLVETVKGYAAHETQLFEEVTQARAEPMKAAGPGPAAPIGEAARDWFGGGAGGALVLEGGKLTLVGAARPAVEWSFETLDEFCQAVAPAIAELAPARG